MYTPAGFNPDSLPWVAFSVAWVLCWVAIIVAVRGAPRRSGAEA